MKLVCLLEATRTPEPAGRVVMVLPSLVIAGPPAVSVVPSTRYSSSDPEIDLGNGLRYFSLFSNDRANGRFQAANCFDR